MSPIQYYVHSIRMTEPETLLAARMAGMFPLCEDISLPAGVLEARNMPSGESIVRLTVGKRMVRPWWKRLFA